MKNIAVLLLFVSFIFCTFGCVRTDTPSSQELVFDGRPPIEIMVFTGDILSLDIDHINTVIAENLDSIDPVEGDVLGRLNDSEVGELVPCGPVLNSISALLEYTDACYGAYDPTLQILWDVYAFGDGGRYVSDYELADALRWVGYREVELIDDAVLRKGENVRLGYGPVVTGAMVDWAVELVTETGIENFSVTCGHSATVSGDDPDRMLEDVSVQEIKYPLDKATEDAYQQIIGYIRLEPGQYMAALDDDENYFFSRGEQYHQVIDTVMGRPVRNVNAAVVVSDESGLQASVFAYAVMVMGIERGLEFLDETEGVEGFLYSEDGEVHVSGGLGDRFWR